MLLAAAAGGAAAAAAPPFLYQGVRPRLPCIQLSFFQSSVFQSAPTRPPTSFVLWLYAHLHHTTYSNGISVVL